MGRFRRHYDRDFKLKVVNQVIRAEKSPTALADEFGISNCMISRWTREFDHDPDNAFPGSGLSKQPPRVKPPTLQEQLRQVTAERDILVKAISIIFNRKFTVEEIESLK